MSKNKEIPVVTNNVYHTPNPKKPFSFYMSLCSLAIMGLITAWDAASLSIALPDITNQLHGTTFQSFWASISFMLGDAISQPIYASSSDVLGRKGPMYAAIAFFSAGAVVFATSQNMSILILGRLLQGIGAGGLDVLPDVILADITSLKERPKYIGVVGIFLAVGMVLGPIIGALLSQFLDWRWIGWINLPIIGVGFLLAVFFLHLKPIDAPFRIKLRLLDWAGMGLLTIGATAVSLPLSWSSSLYAWSSWQTLVPFVIGLFVLVIFGLHEKRTGTAMIPFRIFSNTTAVMSLITSLLNGAIIYSLLQYVTLFFQAIFLQSPIKAAISTLPLCGLVVAFSIITPMIIEVIRRYRMLLWLGWILTLIFSALWCSVDRNTSTAAVYSFQAFLGVGIGIVHIGTSIPIQASVEFVDDTGLAVGVLAVFRIFGALIGLAVNSALFNSIFEKSITTVGTLPEQAKILQDATQAIGFIPTLRTLTLSDETMTSIIGAYYKPFQAIWIFLTILSGLGFIFSLFIKDFTLEREEMGRQGFVESS